MWKTGDIIKWHGMTKEVFFVCLGRVNEEEGLFLSKEFGIDVRLINRREWPRCEQVM